MPDQPANDITDEPDFPITVACDRHLLHKRDCWDCLSALALWKEMRDEERGHAKENKRNA